MTREEAIKTIEEILQLSPTLDETGCSVTEAMKVALSALRPVSREQVEKAWRAHWNESTHLGGFVYCSRCGYNALEANNYTFCPKCGSPFTDEAVDILLKRLEALKNEEV